MKILFLIFAIKAFITIVEMREWWENTHIYEIYVRSFKDTNDDGIGDLNGITENLEYFVHTAVNTILLDPFFDSPFTEGGFDIRDYYKVSPEYGTMQDFDNLMQKAKRLNLKVILELMVNHCSNQSSNFRKSSLGYNNQYKDLFVWADGKIDPETNQRIPPSNWENVIKGSAWEWHPRRKQYYLHQYYKTEPDFNYSNPAVFDGMIRVMRYYLDKGVSGFKMNSAFALVEAKNPDGTFPDDPIRPDGSGKTDHINSHNRNESYDIVHRWRSFLDYYSRFNSGERRIVLTGSSFTNFTYTIKYYGNETHNISHVPYNFGLKDITNQSNAADVVQVCQKWLNNVPPNQVPNWILGNAHSHRVASRIGKFKMNGLMMLQMMLPGIAMSYYGDDIGMFDVPITEEQNTDILGKERGLNYSRDPERTPYQWTFGVNAGFSDGNSTWLPVGDKRINLKQQGGTPKSHFKVFRAASRFRNETAVRDGDLDLQIITNDVFALTRYKKGLYTWGMVMNMGSENVTVNLSKMKGMKSPIKVRVTSINSGKSTGDSLNAAMVELTQEESFIFKAEVINN